MFLFVFRICDIPKFHFCLEPRRIVKGLMAGTLLDVYFPGFPTLKNIPHEVCRITGVVVVIDAGPETPGRISAVVTFTYVNSKWNS